MYVHHVSATQWACTTAVPATRNMPAPMPSQLCLSSKRVLATVGDVEEAIFCLVGLVDGRHQGCCGNDGQPRTTNQTRSRAHGQVRLARRCHRQAAQQQQCIAQERQGHGRTWSRVGHNREYAQVGGRKLLMKTKMAFSGASLMRFRTTYTNWPTVRSAGTRYLHDKPPQATTQAPATTTSTRFGERGRGRAYAGGGGAAKASPEGWGRRGTATAGGSRPWVVVVCGAGG